MLRARAKVYSCGEVVAVPLLVASVSRVFSVQGMRDGLSNKDMADFLRTINAVAISTPNRLLVSTEVPSRATSQGACQVEGETDSERVWALVVPDFVCAFRNST